jgi:hypothetical protein
MKTPHAILAGFALVALAILWVGYTHPVVVPSVGGKIVRVNGLTGQTLSCVFFSTVRARCFDVSQDLEP